MEQLIASYHPRVILIQRIHLVDDYRHLIIFLMMILHIIFIVVDHLVPRAIFFLKAFQGINLTMTRSIYTNSDMLITMMRVVVSSYDIEIPQVGCHG